MRNTEAIETLDAGAPDVSKATCLSKSGLNTMAVGPHAAIVQGNCLVRRNFLDGNIGSPDVAIAVLAVAAELIRGIVLVRTRAGLMGAVPTRADTLVVMANFGALSADDSEKVVGLDSASIRFAWTGADFHRRVAFGQRREQQCQAGEFLPLLRKSVSPGLM
ncbi:MAG: hypothetical protein M3O09_09425 [Acidobacteriota bacterium]|nr:hypothetical protein [Acidobacteriota bacterium]